MAMPSNVNRGKKQVDPLILEQLSDKCNKLISLIQNQKVKWFKDNMLKLNSDKKKFEEIHQFLEKASLQDLENYLNKDEIRINVINLPQDRKRWIKNILKRSRHIDQNLTNYFSGQSTSAKPIENLESEGNLIRPKIINGITKEHVVSQQEEQHHLINHKHIKSDNSTTPSKINKKENYFDLIPLNKKDKILFMEEEELRTFITSLLKEPRSISKSKSESESNSIFVKILELGIDLESHRKMFNLKCKKDYNLYKLECNKLNMDYLPLFGGSDKRLYEMSKVKEVNTLENKKSVQVQNKEGKIQKEIKSVELENNTLFEKQKGKSLSELELTHLTSKVSNNLGSSDKTAFRKTKTSNLNISQINKENDSSINSLMDLQSRISTDLSHNGFHPAVPNPLVLKKKQVKEKKKDYSPILSQNEVNIGTESIELDKPLDISLILDENETEEANQKVELNQSENNHSTNFTSVHNSILDDSILDISISNISLNEIRNNNNVNTNNKLVDLNQIDSVDDILNNEPINISIEEMINNKDLSLDLNSIQNKFNTSDYFINKSDNNIIKKKNRKSVKFGTIDIINNNNDKEIIKTNQLRERTKELIFRSNKIERHQVRDKTPHKSRTFNIKNNLGSNKQLREVKLLNTKINQNNKVETKVLNLGDYLKINTNIVIKDKLIQRIPDESRIKVDFRMLCIKEGKQVNDKTLLFKNVLFINKNYLKWDIEKKDITKFELNNYLGAYKYKFNNLNSKILTYYLISSSIKYNESLNKKRKQNTQIQISLIQLIKNEIIKVNKNGKKVAIKYLQNKFNQYNKIICEKYDSEIEYYNLKRKELKSKEEKDYKYNATNKENIEYSDSIDFEEKSLSIDKLKSDSFEKPKYKVLSWAKRNSNAHQQFYKQNNLDFDSYFGELPEININELFDLDNESEGSQKDFDINNNQLPQYVKPLFSPIKQLKKLPHYNPITSTENKLNHPYLDWFDSPEGASQLNREQKEVRINQRLIDNFGINVIPTHLRNSLLSQQDYDNFNLGSIIPPKRITNELFISNNLRLNNKKMKSILRKSKLKLMRKKLHFMNLNKNINKSSNDKSRLSAY